VTHPFTKLAAQASEMMWTNATHLGTEYAALLVEPGYHRPPAPDDLPRPGASPSGSVVAMARTKGAESPPSKILEFSCYQWRLRGAPSSRGGANQLQERLDRRERCAAHENRPRWRRLDVFRNQFDPQHGIWDLSTKRYFG